MFKNVLGQQKVKNILVNQIKSSKIPHAYIFMGQNGVGRRFTAIEFAKVLNCTTNDFTKTDIGACGKCINCEKIDKNIHPDIHIIDFIKQAELEDEDPEKQKVLKIETMRYMQKIVSTKRHEGKWKFFIIEPAEKMNSAAANSLLKTLEEPPDHTIIILIARHKETIPQTIVSRSQTLFFQPLSQDEIISFLMLNHGISSDKAQEISTLCEGSIEEAEKLLAGNESKGHSLWLKFKNESLYISEILELSSSISRNEAIDYIDAMIAEAKKDFRLFPQNTIAALESLNRSREYILKNVNVQTVLDNLFFDLYDLKRKSEIFNI